MELWARWALWCSRPNPTNCHRDAPSTLHGEAGASENPFPNVPFFTLVFANGINKFVSLTADCLASAITRVVHEKLESCVGNVRGFFIVVRVGCGRGLVMIGMPGKIPLIWRHGPANGVLPIGLSFPLFASTQEYSYSTETKDFN